MQQAAADLADRGRIDEALLPDEPEKPAVDPHALAVGHLDWATRRKPLRETVDAPTQKPKRAGSRPPRPPLPERVCEICGHTFRPSRPWAVTCSPACARERIRRQSRQRWHANLEASRAAARERYRRKAEAARKRRRRP